MEINLNNTTYTATFNFNALDRLMEDCGIEKFSELGSILGQDEDEVSRTTITNYAKLTLYGIEEANRKQEGSEVPELADLKPLLISNPEMLETVANELQNALPQGDNIEDEGGAEKKKMSQAKKNSKASS